MTCRSQRHPVKVNVHSISMKILTRTKSLLNFAKSLPLEALEMSFLGLVCYTY